MVRGLLIEIKDWRTGERAYGIDPRDPNLKALGGPLWQSLDHEPKGDFEIRLVLDDRDLSKYEGKIILDDGTEVTSVAEIPDGAEIVDVEGVVVLNNEDEINKVLDHLPKKIFVSNIDKAEAWGEQKGITLATIRSKRAHANAKAKKGHWKAAQRRKKPLERVIFGHERYYLLKKLHEQGCPYTWEEPIPKVREGLHIRKAR